MRIWPSSPSGDPSQIDLWRAAWGSGAAFLRDSWRELWPLALAFGLGVPLCLALLPSLGILAAVAALAVAGASAGALGGLLWLHAAGERPFWPAWSGDVRLRRAAAGGMVALALAAVAGLGGARVGAGIAGGIGTLGGATAGILAWLWTMAAAWPVAPRWLRGEAAAPAWDRAWRRVPRLLGCLTPAALPLLPAAVLAALLPGILGVAAGAAAVGAALALLALGPAGAATAFPDALGKESGENTH